MTPKAIGRLAARLLLVLVLSLLLSLEILFAISFFQANAATFSILPTVAFAHGWERLWIWVYLASDAGYLLLLGALFLELALFLSRTILTQALLAYATLTGRAQDQPIAVLRKLSLTTPFRLLKVNTPLKGVLVYVGIIVVVLGSGWVAKKVLEANESLVYRTLVVSNLVVEEKQVDLSAAIDDDVVFDIDIAAGVGNVHLYGVAGTTEAKLYFCHDDDAQAEGLVWDVDVENGQITISFNANAISYTRFVDPVPPAIELYLPATLVVDAVDVTLSHYGSLTVDYLDFTSLVAETTDGPITVKGTGVVLGTLSLTSHGGPVKIDVDRCEALTVVLDHATAEITANAIVDTFSLRADDAEAFVYTSIAERIDIVTLGGTLELREVYAPAIQIVGTGGSLLYVNGDADYAYGDVTIDTNGVATVRGLPA